MVNDNEIKHIPKKAPEAIASTISPEQKDLTALQTQVDAANLKKQVTTNIVTDHKKLIDTNTDNLDIETIRNELLVEINQERAKNSLKSLVFDENLNTTAWEYAQYMDKNTWYSHNDKNGVDGSARVKNHGYKKVFMGENIHNGPHSIYDVMKNRMGSAPHANKIVGEFAEDIGIGYCNGYRVIDFGGRYPRIKRDV
ncbi:MAG: CAP domain-containing protein [Candidatus Absconditabacterales bacterium]